MAPEELFWPSKSTISTPLKTKTTPHFSKIAPLCIRFGYLIQGYFSPVYWDQNNSIPKGLKKAPKIAPKIVLYFTHRNGPILGAKTDLFDLQCEEAYNETSQWRKNAYIVPYGKTGKAFIDKITEHINEWNNGMESQHVSVKAAFVLLVVGLQKPQRNPKQRTTRNF